MKIREKLHWKFLKSRCKRNWEKFRELRNKVEVRPKESAVNHLSDEVKANKNNPVAEDFNKYFTSIGKITATAALDLAIKYNIALSDPLLNDASYPIEEQFKFEPVTRSKIRRIITYMPRKKSPGPDFSLQSGVFPDEWKLAEVIPLHKDGDQEIPSNNLPLSLLEVLSKVCEKVAREQFASYITENQRLYHHIKMEIVNTIQTLNIHITDKMLETINNKHKTALVLLDLSQAYHSVNHKILLHKLKCTGA